MTQDKDFIEVISKLEESKKLMEFRIEMIKKLKEKSFYFVDASLMFYRIFNDNHNNKYVSYFSLLHDGFYLSFLKSNTEIVSVRFTEKNKEIEDVDKMLYMIDELLPIILYFVYGKMTWCEINEKQISFSWRDMSSQICYKTTFSIEDRTLSLSKSELNINYFYISAKSYIFDTDYFDKHLCKEFLIPYDPFVSKAIRTYSKEDVRTVVLHDIKEWKVEMRTGLTNVEIGTILHDLLSGFLRLNKNQQ